MNKSPCNIVSKERFSLSAVLKNRISMLKNTYNRWKRARCRYLGNTPCVLLIEEESTENS